VRFVGKLAVPCAVIALSLLAVAAVAHATFAGANGLLAYEDLEGSALTIRVVSPDGTGARSLFPPGDLDHDPSWSPDGRKLVFARTIAGNDDIWVCDLARPTRLRRLTFDPADDKEPAWSPDNRHVVFSSARDGNPELYLVDTETLALQRLTFDPAVDSQPAWSQDDRIVFVSDRMGNPDLFETTPVPGAPVTQLTSNPGPDVDPSWSPSGSLLAYASGATKDAMHLFTIAPDGSGKRRLTRDTSAERFPTWAPDGTAIAYTRQAPSPRLTVASMNPGGRGVRPAAILSAAEHPNWSPLTPAPPPSQPPAIAAKTVTVAPALGPISAVPGKDSAAVRRIASRIAKATQLPVGRGVTSTVVATAGLAVIRGATTTPSSRRPIARLDSTRAEITQSIPSAPLTVTLTSRPRGCRATPAGATTTRHRGHRHPPNIRMRGRWRVRGKYSIAGSIGTRWTLAETCSGTVTVVHRGTVTVTDNGRTPLQLTSSRCHVASPRPLTRAERRRACAQVRALPR
jgi:hypothetical protein